MSESSNTDRLIGALIVILLVIAVLLCVVIKFLMDSGAPAWTA